MMKGTLRITIAAIICLALIAPGFASEKVDAKDSEKRIENELQAMKEREKQSKCPIMAGDVTPAKSVTYMGYEIMTCCPACEKPIKENPKNAILQIRKNDEEPYLAKGFEKQSKCPISGKPVKDEHFTIKNNALVKFCCPNCKGVFEKEPEKYVKKMLENKQAPILITLEQKMCPISGHKISKESSAVVEGKKVYFCCDGCKKPFNEKKKEHLQAMADNGIVLSNAKE